MLNSLQFNGTSSKVALTGLTGLSAGFSYACWIKAVAPTTAAQGIVCNATSTNDRACMTFIGQTPSGLIGAGYFNGTVFSGVKSTDAALQPQKWYHVAYTYNGTTGALYLNSAPQRGSTNPSTAATNALIIGGRNDSSLFCPCKMREILIYKRALSRAEVNDLYLTGRVPTAPTGMYMLDEGNGATARDLSGAAVNGTITAGLWSRDIPDRIRARIKRNRRMALTY